MNTLRALKKYLLQNKLIAAAGFFAIVAALTLNAPGGCITPRERSPVEGTQGYRIWFGDALQTFNHENRKVCIPEGWEAIGAEETTDEWARFERSLTGILIRSDAFNERELAFENSNFFVRMRYPNSLSQERAAVFEKAVRHTFESVGALYSDDAKIERVRHTVLITAGLSGSFPNESRIYPDPRASVTVFVADPRISRGEELFMHAVVHLYNRFTPHMRTYQKNQSPLSADDLQELEATWAETAFHTTNSGRILRLEYLYNVHVAVQNKNFNLITEPPFNNEGEFNAINPSVLVTKTTSDINIQYGHYVLGPLIMVAIEGLLQKNGGLTDVKNLLQHIHQNPTTQLLKELRRYIPESEILQVERWMFEGETIPYELIEVGRQYYDAL